MDDGADPGEIGPAGQFVGVEIAGHQRTRLGSSRAASRCRAWTMASGRSKIVALAAGTARRKARVHVPEAPPTSSRWWKSRLPRRADQAVGHGGGNGVHGGDEGGPIRLGPADALLPRSRMARLDHGGQLRPVPQTRHAVLDHRQHGLGRAGGQKRPQHRGRGVVRAGLFEKAQGRQGVQQHGHGPRIGGGLVGQFRGGAVPIAQGGEEVQFGGRAEHAARLIVARAAEDVERDRGDCVPWRGLWESLRRS